MSLLRPCDFFRKFFVLLKKCSEEDNSTEWKCNNAAISPPIKMSPSTIICDNELDQNLSHSCCFVCLLTKSQELHGGNYAPKGLLLYVMRQLLVITVMLIVMRLFVLWAGNKIEILQDETTVSAGFCTCYYRMLEVQRNYTTILHKMQCCLQAKISARTCPHTHAHKDISVFITHAQTVTFPYQKSYGTAWRYAANFFCHSQEM